MRKFRNLGQSLFEIMFAVAIAALITTGIVVLSTDSVKNSSFSKDKTVASKLAQEANEWLRSQRDENWSNLSSRIGTNCLGDLSWSSSCTVVGTKFSREVILNSISQTEIEAVVVVSWESGDSGGNMREVRTVTRFTDWK